MRYFLLAPLILCISIMAIFCFSTGVSAEVEWDVLKSVDLQESPLDIAVSRDGTTAFILCEKSIQICSLGEGRVKDTIPLTNRFSRIALSPDNETLLLTDSEKKQLTVIRVIPVYHIEIGKSPVIGKPDVPVTIVAFVDFQ